MTGCGLLSNSFYDADQIMNLESDDEEKSGSESVEDTFADELK